MLFKQENHRIAMFKSWQTNGQIDGHDQNTCTWAGVTAHNSQCIILYTCIITYAGSVSSICWWQSYGYRKWLWRPALVQLGACLPIHDRRANWTRTSLSYTRRLGHLWTSLATENVWMNGVRAVFSTTVKLFNFYRKHRYFCLLNTWYMVIQDHYNNIKQLHM